jgi:hypothetical protein
MRKSAQAMVSACADAMFPPAGPIPVSGTQAGLVAYVESYLRSLSLLRRILVRMLFLFIQLSPWLFGPRRSCFTRLRPAERIRVLKDMAVSRLYLRRISFLSMRAIMTMGYFACPLVASHIMRIRRETVTP